MATYAAYLPPQERSVSPADDFRLVKDAKTTIALVFPPVWLIWHRLWLPLLAYIAALFAIILLGAWQPGLPVLYLSALPGLYLLVEGSALITSNLERRGWRFAGTVEGDNLDEAEIRFLKDLDVRGLDVPAPPVKPVNPVNRTYHKVDVTPGLFPE